MQNLKDGFRVLQLVVTLLLGSILLLLPYGQIHDAINRLSSSGAVMDLYRLPFEATKWTLRFIGLVLLAVGLLSLFLEQPLRNLFKNAFQLLRHELADLRRTLIVSFKRDKTAWAAVFAVTVIGGALRMSFLGRPMLTDESINFLYYVVGPAERLVKSYYPHNHLLHNVLTRVFVSIWGERPEIIRLAAFIPSVLSVPAVFLFCRLYFKSIAVAVLASVFVATSPLCIDFGTNSRGYAGVIFLFVLGMSAAILCVRKKTVWPWIAFGILHGLGLLVHPTYLYPLVIADVWLLVALWKEQLTVTNKTYLVRFVHANAIAGLLACTLYVPLIFFSSPMIGASFYLKRSTFMELWEQAKRIAPVFVDNFVALYPDPIKLFLGGGAILFLITHRRVSRFKVNYFALSLLTLAVLIVLRPQDIQVRFYIFLLPLFLIAASAGFIPLVPRKILASKSRPLCVGLLAVAVLVGSLVSSRIQGGLEPTEDSITLDDGPAIAQYLKPLLKENDVVVYPYARGFNLNYYFHRLGIPKRFLGPVPDPSRVFWVANLKLGGAEGYTQSFAPTFVTEFSAPVLVAKFPHAELYVRHKETTPNHKPNLVTQFD